MNEEFRDRLQRRVPVAANADDDGVARFVAVTTDRDGNTVVDLDGAHPDVVRGSWVVLSQDGPAASIASSTRWSQRAELSRAEFGVSGKVTRLTLRGEAHAFGTPREVTVMAVAEPLTVVEAPDDTAVGGHVVVVDGDATEMAEGRTVVLAGTTADGTAQSEVVTVDRRRRRPGGRTTLTLSSRADDVLRPLHRSRLRQRRARHPRRDRHPDPRLGGRAPRRSRPSRLQQGPLTFVPAESTAGAASTLRGPGRRRALVRAAPPRTASEPRDRVFVTRDEPDGTPQRRVRRRSARRTSGHRLEQRARDLPQGHRRRRQPTRRATEPGAGPAARAQGRDQPGARRPAASTRRDPHARVLDPGPRAHPGPRGVPAGLRRLRARVHRHREGGRDRAPAARRAHDRGHGRRRGRPSLRRTRPWPGSAMRFGAQSDPHVRVVVLPVAEATFRLALKVRIDPTARERSGAARRGRRPCARRTATAQRNLGEPVHRSAVVAAAAAVPGVVAVDLDRLYREGDATVSGSGSLARPRRSGGRAGRRRVAGTRGGRVRLARGRCHERHPSKHYTGQRLFDLLPVVHRLRDAEHGHVLRELIEVLADQVDVLSEEIAQLYDDQFIETCAPWAAPYIGRPDRLPRAARRGARWCRRRAPRSPTRSATGAARAPRRCSSSSRATSPAGRPAPWSSSSGSSPRST